MKYGYARVSSLTQDYASQVEQLEQAGCARIFSEKQSGKTAKDRPEFQKLMKKLKAGDTLVICKLDRLARSARDLHNILGELTERGCEFVSLNDSWCDTRTPTGRMVITIMSGIAQFERELILERTGAGIARARANGTVFGRKVKLSPRQRLVLAQKRADGATLRELAGEYQVSEPTIWRALQ